jgi:hypothetical protein
MLLRYLGALALADYERSGAADPKANTWLKDSFRRIPQGDGRWLEVILQTGRASLRGTSKSFFAEAPSIWVTSPTDYAPLTGALARLRDLRNADVHDQAMVSDALAEHWLSEALPVWQKILEKAAPLFRYPLLSVEGHEGFEGESLNVYLVRWLAGQSLFSRWEKMAWAARLSKGRVYLCNARRDAFLKLDPFLAYRPCAITRSHEAWSLDLISDEVTFVTFRFSQKDKSRIELPRCLS